MNPLSWSQRWWARRVDVTRAGTVFYPHAFARGVILPDVVTQLRLQSVGEFFGIAFLLGIFAAVLFPLPMWIRVVVIGVPPVVEQIVLAWTIRAFPRTPQRRGWRDALGLRAGARRRAAASD